MPDPQRVGYRDPPFRSESLDGNPGIAGLQRSNAPLQRRTDIIIRQDVELRPKPFCGTLPHREAAAGAAVERMMRVVSLLGLPVPAHLQPDVIAAHPVIDPPVAEILQHVAADPRREVVGPAALAGKLAKLRQAHQGWPPARRENFDVPLPVEWLLGKQRLVHPIHQMHAGIRQALALLGDIEIPSGARVRQAGDDFAQVMHAAQQDTRLVSGTRDRVAEHFRVTPQGLQQPDERVMSPGHHVSQHQPPFLRQCKRRLEPQPDPRAR